MVGYPEALTDPSYAGQILIPTYPLIGNYGAPDPAVRVPLTDEPPELPPRPFESERIHVRALVVAHYHADYTHHRARRSLSAWLQSEHVPALYGVDTRALAKKLQQGGSLLGKVILLDDHGRPPCPWYDPNTEHLVASVSTRTPVWWTPTPFDAATQPTILAVDMGMVLHSAPSYGAVRSPRL